MSLRQADLVKRWGVSRNAVSLMCKAGMPLEDVAGAEAWRRANRGWDGSIKFTSLPCSMGAGGQNENGPRQTPPADDAAAAQRDGMDGLVARAVHEERVAYQWVIDARRAQAGNQDENKKGSFAFDLSQASKAWRAASEFRVGAERDLLEHRARSGDLVPVAVALEMIERAHRPVRKLVRLLPQTMKSRCNPGDPDRAEAELKEWSDHFFATVFREVKRA